MMKEKHEIRGQLKPVGGDVDTNELLQLSDPLHTSSRCR